MTEESNDLQYREKLGQALRSANAESVRAFLLEQARHYGDEEQVNEIASQPIAELTLLMHRMILARPDLADLHAASNAALGTKPASLRTRRQRPPNRER
jgi:hypothetical protein